MTPDHATIEPPVPRMLPRLTDTNRAFWTGGAGGQLLVPWCRACHRWTLPPVAACPTCQGEVTSEPVSGRGTVYTFTLNAHQFHPAVPPPNLIAIVQLDEQDDLRIATDLVNCREEDARCGMPVSVLFEQHGEIYYPLFEPIGSTA